MWTENIHSQQYSKWSWMDLSDFYSDSISTPAWMRFRISNSIGVGHCFLNCPFIFSSFSRKYPFFALFQTFWWFDVLSTDERKVSQWAKFEFVQEDAIWFLVRRLNLPAITAWQRFYFYLCSSLFFWNCYVSFTFSKYHVKTYIWEFRSVNMLSSVDWIFPESAIFEL